MIDNDRLTLGEQVPDDLSQMELLCMMILDMYREQIGADPDSDISDDQWEVARRAACVTSASVVALHRMVAEGQEVVLTRIQEDSGAMSDVIMFVDPKAESAVKCLDAMYAAFTVARRTEPL